jgi:hypothetical protein
MSNSTTASVRSALVLDIERLLPRPVMVGSQLDAAGIAALQARCEMINRLNDLSTRELRAMLARLQDEERRQLANVWACVPEWAV